MPVQELNGCRISYSLTWPATESLHTATYRMKIIKAAYADVRLS